MTVGELVVAVWVIAVVAIVAVWVVAVVAIAAVVAVVAVVVAIGSSVSYVAKIRQEFLTQSAWLPGGSFVPTIRHKNNDEEKQ